MVEAHVVIFVIFLEYSLFLFMFMFMGQQDNQILNYCTTWFYVSFGTMYGYFFSKMQVDDSAKYVTGSIFNPNPVVFFIWKKKKNRSVDKQNPSNRHSYIYSVYCLYHYQNHWLVG